MPRLKNKRWILYGRRLMPLFRFLMANMLFGVCYNEFLDDSLKYLFIKTSLCLFIDNLPFYYVKDVLRVINH